VVIAVAVVTFVIWSLVGPSPRLAHAMVSAVAVLIIACPCALGLATPMSIMVATGRGAALGVLFRNAEAIETMRKVDTLVVDKTGTLTEGKPRLVSLVTVRADDEPRMLRLVGSLERGSEHPLAGAIVKAAAERKVTLVEATGFESRTGKGVLGSVDGQPVALGNETLMRDLGVDVGPLVARVDPLRSDGQTVLFVAVDGKLAGLVGVADPIKASTSEAIRALRADGVRQPGHGRRRGAEARARRRRRRGAARPEGRGREALPGRGPDRRDGWRRGE
jgi:Cu+-exporting ATPase